MRSHDATLGVRISTALRGVVRQGGELSAATRALLIIGAATSGLDLSEVYEEIVELLSGRLRPEVRAQLLALIGGVGERPHGVPVRELVGDDRFEDDDLLLGDADGQGLMSDWRLY